ncbi:MAG: cell division/cell wall cluster transcriptional repressor MraZ [Sulfobacillus acidophilus]|uniref:Transcriptional regulator MraZ n=1 Tax=Sulfobacillus acidophilus TaxID=53633 RepID=A0A2T2WEL1_9FIRM|nr:MAG: cell division/cell wall cluster transcriptional repressor MraZ [Sulfobacillus acidophilus]
MMMGEFSHALDEKGRIIIPARLRDDLDAHFVMTKGLDGCLFLYPMGEWKKLEERLKALPLTNASARAFQRLFLAGAQDVEVDRQSRVTIPPRLREYAAVVKEVVLVGVSNRVELWALERWQAYQTQAQAGYEDVAEKMVEFGF